MIRISVCSYCFAIARELFVIGASNFWRMHRVNVDAISRRLISAAVAQPLINDGKLKAYAREMSALCQKQAFAVQ